MPLPGAKLTVRFEAGVAGQGDRGSLCELDYLENESPLAAIDIDERIARHVEQLAVHPESGRVGRVAGARELVIDLTPYIAAYRTTGETVIILRVLHGSRAWPDVLSD